MFKAFVVTVFLAAYGALAGPAITTRYLRPRCAAHSFVPYPHVYGCRTCGTTISDEKLLAHEAHFQANKVAKTGAAAATATVNVFWHVISQVCLSAVHARKASNKNVAAYIAGPCRTPRWRVVTFRMHLSLLLVFPEVTV